MSIVYLRLSLFASNRNVLLSLKAAIGTRSP